MKLEVGKCGTIILKEVFNGIQLETDKEYMVISMRDSGFEFNYNGKIYSAKNNIVERLTPLDKMEERYLKLNKIINIINEDKI